MTDSRASVMVAQLGARRHYAVPMAFQAQQRLRSLCTDLLLPSWQADWVRRLGVLSGNPAMRRLADRQASLPLDSARITTFPLFGLRYKWRGSRARTAEQRTANWLWGGREFALRCADCLDEHTSAVYAFTSAAKELFVAARERGLPTWLDYATAPRTFEVGLIKEEAQRFPGWAIRPVEDALTDTFLARQKDEVRLATRIVCGSSFAKRAIESEGADPHRVVVVPLGVADHLFSNATKQKATPAQRTLNVLYIGGDGLRKGIGYLERALTLLDSTAIVARACGDLELSEDALKQLARRIELLGTVPRSQIPSLFAWADVLVLPSISDTFGMVILEAMAAGLPVIASENTSAPDIVRDGVDGFVVPIRDPQAIANALANLAADPELCVAMGRSARQRADEFSVRHYGSRLIAALGLEQE